MLIYAMLFISWPFLSDAWPSKMSNLSSSSLTV